MVGWSVRHSVQVLCSGDVYCAEIANLELGDKTPLAAVGSGWRASQSQLYTVKYMATQRRST